MSTSSRNGGIKWILAVATAIITFLLGMQLQSFMLGKDYGELVTTVKDNTSEIVELTEALRVTNDKIETKMDDRFRGADARALEERFNRQIDQLSNEIDKCCH